MTTGCQRRGGAGVVYWFVAALVILPLLVLAGGLLLSWRSAISTARQDLRHNAALIAERAEWVLDTNLLVAQRVNEMAVKLDDAALVSGEARLGERIQTIIRHFPQVEAVAIAGPQGQVLLASRPVPQATSISRPARGTSAYSIGGPGLTITVPRDAPGEMAGGAVLAFGSVSFLTALLDHADLAAGLFRSDGVELARAVTGGPVSAALPQPASSGSGTDEAGDRLIAWQQVGSYPVYATVARSNASIAEGWWTAIRLDLVFAVVSVGASLSLGLLVIVQVRRQAEAQASLRAEVQHREAAETTLRQAQRLEAIGRLTGGIAHDVNNHLTVINSNIELLKRRLPDEAKALDRFIEAAMQGVQRAATLTHRLLTFSRQQPLDPEPLDVGRLVTGMLDLLRRTLGEGIRIQTDLASGLWPTRVDGNQLENVLLNLAINARDAMPGGGTLTIRTGNVQPDGSCANSLAAGVPGQFVSVSVADSGHGMTADVIANAFEPFFTTKPQGEGPGLGLSMVYGFVKQSGGHVHIVSEPDQGCVVKLYLPRFIAATGTVTSPQRRDRAAREGVGETILVVEDDEEVRHATVEVLKELGYRVLEAPDAMEAFRLILDRGGIDLLFTDVGLPGGVNGHALADAVRNVSSEIKLLFTTGYAGAAGLDGGVAVGAPVLAKPFDMRQLGAVVRDVLDAPSPRTGVREPAAEKA
jgi:signal transduction histidine kinase/CheY-like chemotaxis protein